MKSTRRPEVEADGAPQVCVLLEPQAPLASQAAHELADRLQLPLLAAADIAAHQLVLAPTAQGLELREGDAPTRRGVKVDFRGRAVTAQSRRRPGHSVAGQPLLRAVGRGSGRVFDATAGFGDDAILLASLGRLVTAVERSPVVAALLEDGRQRALADTQLRESAERLTVRCGDSRALLAALPAGHDVIYLDPMFPPKRRASALPRRPLQLLRRLVGEDPDADALLEAALASGVRRVVVKRSHAAPPLGGRPSSSHAGKLVRYDVYELQPRRSSRGAARDATEAGA